MINCVKEEFLKNKITAEYERSLLFLLLVLCRENFLLFVFKKLYTFGKNKTYGSNDS